MSRCRVVFILAKTHAIPFCLFIYLFDVLSIFPIHSGWENKWINKSPMLVLLMSHPLMSSCRAALWTLIYFYKSLLLTRTHRVWTVKYQRMHQTCVRLEKNVSLGAAISPMAYIA